MQVGGKARYFITVMGFTDQTGDKAFNDQLSRSRADQVIRTWLAATTFRSTASTWWAWEIRKLSTRARAGKRVKPAVALRSPFTPPSR